MASFLTDSVVATKALNRAPISRVRTGCLTCRARKKKCDERKPRCHGCERNYVTCRWPAHVQASMCKAPSDDEAQDHQESSPGRSYNETAHTLDGREVAATSLALTAQSKAAWLENRMEILSTEPTLFPGQPPSSFYFFSHYLHTTSNLMINGASPINPFLVYMVPLAFSSDLIHQLLLTNSAAHWVRRSRDRPDTMSYTHYGKSLRLFRESINDYISRGNGNVILLGVGALTLCFIENVRGDATGTIYDHLLAAKSLLVKILSDTGVIITTDLRCFIIEYYVYTATLSMISTDVRVGNQNFFTDELSHHAESLVEAQYIGNMCGCWLELLLLIPSIFDLGRRWLTNGEAGALNIDYMTQFAVIQHKILQWKPNTSVEPDVALLGLTYQQAILLYLYTVPSSCQHMQLEGLIGRTIDNAMGYMRDIPPTACVNTNMCWPIAIIGSLSTDFAEQQEIRRRLVTMNTTLGFGNILQVLGILEDMWQHPSGLIGPWNICTVMQKLQIWISFS